MTAHHESITVAVTGVGAIIGQGIVKSLRCSRHMPRIVGIDRSDRSPGPHLVDVFEKKPDCQEDDARYLEYWAHIIKAHGIQLILPGLEIDMAFFDRHRAFFEKAGAKLALNRPALILLTSDKWEFGETLARIGYPQIPSVKPASWGSAVAALGTPPFLLKPLNGNGSRGIVLLQDERDFEYWHAKANYDWMLQRIVGTPEQEYTVGIFGLGDGQMVGPLIFRRRLSAAGNTLEAEVVCKHPVLEAAVGKLAALFQPLGPTNLQFRVENDIAYLLEINPRFSSSNSLRTAFGFNEADMSIDFYLFDKRPAAPDTTTGIAWRYSEDFVIHAGNPV